MMGLFDAALNHFRDTPSLKVMLIRATGRYFCSGADMRGGDQGGPARTGAAIREKHRRGLHGMHRIYDEMEHIEKPIVIAHHAMCVGGGLEMSLSCDFRLAAKSAAYALRSEEHTSELQSLMRISYAVFCLNKKKQQKRHV